MDTQSQFTSFDPGKSLPEVERALFAAIVESSDDAIISKTLEGIILSWNPAAEAIFGYSAAEVVGKSMLLLFPPDRVAEESEILTRIGRGERVHHFETVRRRKDGTLIDVSATISPVKDSAGKVIGASKIARDISEKKRLEAESKQREVDLRRSNAELEQFAYVASHDLQEPLRAVAGCVQLLKRRYAGQLDDKADEYIGHAVAGVLRMQALISDLLSYSRIGTEKTAYQEVDCTELLREVLAGLQVAVEESGAVVRAEGLPVVRGIKGQLGQLFQNLISNAIKFRADRSPEILLTAVAGPTEWQFAVADNGIGIEAQYFERIFRLYQRLHTRSHSPGTGIGLALCKKIVERHHGQVWVEAVPGQGSTFYFTLPL